MRTELNDIRLLKLAEMYEAAYEHFIVELAERVVKDDEIRRGVMKLVAPTDMHGERIAAQLVRLNESVSEEDHEGILHAALLDVRDVERAARDFYLGHADQVHDPEVAKLFRNLAHEEGEHLRIAEGLLQLHQRKTGRAFAPDEFAGFRLLTSADAPPLREGVSDFGHSRLHKVKP